jgi:hypothetical protein
MKEERQARKLEGSEAGKQKIVNGEGSSNHSGGHPKRRP